MGLQAHCTCAAGFGRRTSSVHVGAAAATVSGGGLVVVVVRLRSHASWYLLQSACRPPRRGGREGSEVFNSLSIDCMAYHGEVGMEFFRVCSVFLEGSIEISHSNLNPTCATIYYLNNAQRGTTYVRVHDAVPCHHA